MASGRNDAYNKLGNVEMSIRIRDLKSGELIHKLTGHTGLVRSVLYSPSGEFLASGRRIQNYKLGSYDNTIRLWDLKKGNQIMLLKGHKMGITSIALSPGGESLASGLKESSNN